jgi:hypothetical protein
MFDVRGAKWLNGFSYFTPYTGKGTINNPYRIITKDNVNVSNGTLKLTAKYGTENPVTNQVNWKGITYSSEHSRSAITANYDLDYYCPKSWDEDGDGVNDKQIGFNYGIFEIRAKIPRNVGDYSAYWFWANPYQCGNNLNSIKCSSDPLDPDFHPLYTGLDFYFVISEMVNLNFGMWYNYDLLRTEAKNQTIMINSSRPADAYSHNQRVGLSVGLEWLIF